MRNVMNRIVPLLVVGLLLGASPAGADPIFVDNFNNANPVHSDTIQNYWTSTPGSGCSITEPAGESQLSVSIGAVTQSWAKFQGQAGTDLYFFDQGKTFTFSGIQATDPTADALFMVLLAPGQVGTSTDSPMIGVRIYLTDGSGGMMVRVGAKNGGTSNVFSGDSVIREFTTTGVITDYSLTMDATNYTLKVKVGTEESTYTGAHGLSKTAWDASSDKLTMNMMWQDLDHIGAFTAKLGSVSVTPEPTTTSLLLTGSMLLAVHKKNR